MYARLDKKADNIEKANLIKCTLQYRKTLKFTLTLALF